MALTKAHNRMIEGAAVNVKDFGAVGDGVTDDTTAIQAALTAAEKVHIPAGTYLVSSQLNLKNRQFISGDGRVATTISYSGSGNLFGNSTGGRIFDVTILDLYVNDTGTGVDAFALKDVVKGHFERIEVNGFDRAFALITSTSPTNNALYNRFINCMANNCGVGWDFEKASAGSSTSGANSNTVAFCRSNGCTDGIKINNTNDVTVIGCQFEAGTNGVSITDDVGGVSNRNRIVDNRFENNSGTNISIGLNVNETVLLTNYYVGTGTRLSDSGTRTQDLDLFGQDWQLRLTSPYSTAEGSFQFARTTSATSSEPMAVFDDQNSGSGTPVTVDIQTARLLGKPLRIRNTSNDVFLINGQGHIETNQSSANTNTPTGATAHQLAIYDEAGSLLGYIPIYGSAW